MSGRRAADDNGRREENHQLDARSRDDRRAAEPAAADPDVLALVRLALAHEAGEDERLVVGYAREHAGFELCWRLEHRYDVERQRGVGGDLRRHAERESA